VKERKDLGLHNNEEADIDYLESLTDIGGIEDALITNYQEVFGDWTNRTEPFLNGNFHYERIDYDILGRRAVKTNEFGSIRYAYDYQDRLLRAGNRAYDYDGDGNRTREYFTDQAWSVDDTGLNLYVTENNLNNPGNGNGLGIGKLNGNDPNPHSGHQEAWSEFIYRADNRMVEYTDSQGEQWEYRYDSFGRRYEKERLGSAHPEKDVWRDDQIWYVGLTHNILAEYTDIESWNEKTIQTGLEYLVGPGGRAYGAHERYTRNGHEWSPSSWKNHRYYHYDRLGSATAVSLDKPGAAGETFNYGPFGDVLDGEHRWGWDYNGNHHMGFDSVGFTGYRIDAESGLYHAPFREYDPLVASWTTTDPIKSGELWYAYCSNNPVRFTDPLGLEGADSHECEITASTLFDEIEMGFEGAWYYKPGTSVNATRVLEALSDPDFQALHEKYLESKQDFRKFAGFMTYLVVSMAPGFGEVMDAGELILSLEAGDYAAASFALGGLFLPEVIEQLVKGGVKGFRALRKIARSSDEIAEALQQGGRVFDDVGRGTGELHHIASDKSIKSGFTDAYEKIFSKAGMTLDDAANKIFLEGHKGAHTNVYKQYVLDTLKSVTQGLSGDAYKNALLNALDDLRQQLLNNPRMPYLRGLQL
jgi:RHS repeat-associated protein